MGSKALDAGAEALKFQDGSRAMPRGAVPLSVTLEQPEVDLFNMLTFRESFYLGKPASAAFVF